ncbi:hypothetical protein [Mesorhizobium sp.]|uniref:hypothetical protein n=1 Tax=Mesorhizobium sp. TaxID=1871066 RepID=UPI0025CEB330|nr:hypothetical protein [Mesorhizobium sp.]
MITLNLWEIIKAQTLDDREIAETLRDRDVQPAKPTDGKAQRKGAAPGLAKRRD